MQLDYCLILSAGLGSRMGEIGRILPKPLWPIFEKNLIELQIKFAKKFKVKKIFVNTHHGHEYIEQFLIKEYPGLVTILYEKELLDVGGAIHRLASLESINYKGTLLTINSDQFLFFDQQIFSESVKLLKTKPVALFLINIPLPSQYNLVEIDENSNIVSLNKGTNVTKLTHQYSYTYSGMGLINLSFLKKSSGKSGFFQTVADYKTMSIKAICLNEYEYWDFGTKERYVSSIIKLFSLMLMKKNTKCDFLNLKSSFIEFCIENNVFQFDKIFAENESYDSNDKKFSFKFTTYDEKFLDLNLEKDVHKSMDGSIVNLSLGTISEIFELDFF